MKERDPDLLLFHAPLLRQGMTTPKAMRDVIIALLPATGASLWFFGLSAVLVLGSSIAGAVAAGVPLLLAPLPASKLHGLPGLLDAALHEQREEVHRELREALLGGGGGDTALSLTATGVVDTDLHHL